MTDRYFAFTVLLEDTIRDDDAQPIIDAIKQIRGVMGVEAHIANPDLYWQYEKARREILDKLINILISEKEENK